MPHTLLLLSFATASMHTLFQLVILSLTHPHMKKERQWVRANPSMMTITLDMFRKA